MNHLDSWEENLRGRLVNHRSAPPATGWERLEASLAAQSRPKPFYRRAAFVVSALSVAASLTLVVLLRPDAPVLQQMRTELSQTERQMRKAAAPVAESAVRSVTRPVPQAVPHRVPAQVLRHTSLREALGADSTLSCAEKVPQVMARLGAAASPDSVAVIRAEGQSEQRSPSHTRSAQAATPAPRRQQMARSATPTDERLSKSATAQRVAGEGASKHRFRPQISAAVSAAPSVKQQGSGYYMAKAVAASAVSSSSNLYHESADMALLFKQNDGCDVNTRVSHRTPFRVGLSVALPVSERWSLATGITYTRLSTDIVSGSETSYFRTEQRLHFVGVPLQADFTVFASRRFNAYAAVGVQLEKCVKGERNTGYCVLDTYKSNAAESARMAQGLWQFSVQASAGLQFNLTRRVGLYLEPGVAYYVPDGSSLPTIRHEKPWQFNFQGGLRYTLPEK